MWQRSCDCSSLSRLRYGWVQLRLPARATSPAMRAPVGRGSRSWGSKGRRWQGPATRRPVSHRLVGHPQMNVDHGKEVSDMAKILRLQQLESAGAQQPAGETLCWSWVTSYAWAQ